MGAPTGEAGGFLAGFYVTEEDFEFGLVSAEPCVSDGDFRGEGSLDGVKRFLSRAELCGSCLDRTAGLAEEIEFPSSIQSGGV